MNALTLSPAQPITAIVSTLPAPNLHDWVGVMLLRRYGWEKYEQAACVLAYNPADTTRVMIGYISPYTRRPTTTWVNRSSIVRIYNRVTDAEFLQASI